MTQAGVRIAPRALGAPLAEQSTRAVLHNEVLNGQLLSKLSIVLITTSLGLNVYQ